MATGLTTGLISGNPLSGSYTYRNAIQANVQNNIFTTTEKYDSKVGPTRENLANIQHQQDINNLAAEIAAAETPEAKAARDDKNYFAKSAEEKSIQNQKDALQKKINDDILEQCVKADPYYLIARDWDRKVIMAANGETVTVELEDKNGKVDKNGAYPIKTIEITKSPRLRKLTYAPVKKKRTTPTDIKNAYAKKKDACTTKFEKAGIVFGISGRIMGGNSTMITAYKKEMADLDDQCQAEIANLAKAEDMEPPSQGKNVEPHTIAIYAPGFCMNDGCCLERAYYTLRSCCKAIEDNAEAEATAALKGLYDERKERTDKIASIEADKNNAYKAALEKASTAAVEAYREAYKNANEKIEFPPGSGRFVVIKHKQPNPADYTAEKWLEEHDELLGETGYYDLEAELADEEYELSMFQEDLDNQLKETIEKYKTDAKNYRILLDHCSFQPTCPEWLEDLGSAVVSGAKKTAEAIGDAFEWTVDAVSTSVKWMDDAVNTSLAYLGDLHDELNAVIGFEGLCDLNPFGGTLGCANCPMGSKCKSDKEGLLGKIKKATSESEFLKNLGRALGLGKGQLLGNLLRCAAALSGNIAGTLNAVSNFSIASGMSSVLGPASSILGTQNLPNFNTKVATCIGATSQLSEAKAAVDLLNKTADSPMAVLQSNTPGLNTKVVDMSKLDMASRTSNHFSKEVLGKKTDMLTIAKNQVDYKKPSGSTKYYDGKNVDNDSVTKQSAVMDAAKVYDKVDTKKLFKQQENLKKGLPAGMADALKFT